MSVLFLSMPPREGEGVSSNEREKRRESSWFSGAGFVHIFKHFLVEPRRHVGGGRAAAHIFFPFGGSQCIVCVFSRSPESFITALGTRGISSESVFSSQWDQVVGRMQCEHLFNLCVCVCVCASSFVGGPPSPSPERERQHHKKKNTCDGASVNIENQLAISNFVFFSLF